MIELEIKRRNLHQWDHDQRVKVDYPAGTEVHFSTPWHSQDSIPVLIAYEEDGSVYADIPNLFLTKPGTITAYIFIEDGEGGYTEEKRAFNVEPKPKPDDYVYTETEVWTAEKAVEKALQEAKERGDFKGDPGPKGDPGAVKYVVVTELPETDTENAIYLLPNEDNAEGNVFDEYIFVDGKWEKIGSASVAVNLDEYVKKTDAAELGGELGLVKLQNQPGYSGITLGPNGQLCLHSADSFAIDKKTNYRAPITPFVLDHAVKIGVTTNTETLTAEEKAAACEWLGAVEKLPIATGNERTRVNCNRYNHSTKDYTLVVDEYRTATNWAIPVRNSNGGIYIPDGAIKDDSVIPAGEVAVNRKYVDGLVGDIETALDGIIAIQNELIGGAGE